MNPLKLSTSMDGTSAEIIEAILRVSFPFDPPFQPTTSHQVEGIISKRFTTVSTMAELRESVQLGAVEAHRVSRLGFVVKVQDYIHSQRPVWMSMWLWEVLGEPYDFVTLRVKSKLIAPNWTRQFSARRNHSTFWIYRHKNRRSSADYGL